jgi:hypothetical protein
MTAQVGRGGAHLGERGRWNVADTQRAGRLHGRNDLAGDEIRRAHERSVRRPSPGVIGARFHEHHAGDLRRVGGLIQTHQPAPVRVADKHVGRPFAGAVEQGVELVDDLAEGARVRAELTPPVARPVVRAHARESGHAGLDEAPFDGEVAESGFENDCGPCGARRARAVEV